MAQPPGVERLVEGGDRGGGLVAEGDALGSEGEVVGGAVDEPEAQVAFQGGEGAGDGGLGEAEVCGGPGDVALVGDGEEGPQMAEFDGPGGDRRASWAGRVFGRLMQGVPFGCSMRRSITRAQALAVPGNA
ncbi:hypothetical protein SMICM304S_12048 [Streptomyces microflavus]